ncbi:nicotinate phosphoribosyltransferase [Robbsia andropogonis]|uniref:Nicotinate phosphoribosyltransferase n=1 Tax=Robbsia andropogonis TaxID=28092 RepID=A0A0F5JTI6_9BURK|nr:nicotinate phosphoribosyltransferase [Robbsia andropogonis]
MRGTRSRETCLLERNAVSLPKSDDQHLWISWDEYHRLVERLALQIHESAWRFDFILCLARGGLRVGDQLSRIYDLPLAILSTSSYREAAGTIQGQLDIAQYITMTRGPLRGNVLLVDDLVDSGITLARVQGHLAERFPDITEVRSAVLWYKACSVTRPDYHVSHLPTNPWIHQPFEEWDTLRPQNLAAWIQRGLPRQSDVSDESHNDN